MSGRAAKLVLALVVLSTLITPFTRELFVGDETKYTQVVREMRAGNFFLPTLNGSPFTHKPPLHFWLVDLLTYPFGVYSIWPYVLPSLAAFALLLWLMHRIRGPFAAFVCGTALMVWGSAQTARMDVSFTALLVVGAWMLERFFDRDDFRALLWCAVAVAIAALIKGPMAPVITLVLFVFEWIRRRRVPRGNYLPAILALIAIPLLWVVPAVILGGEAFWREIFHKQTVGRAVGAWVHKSPPWFYVVRAPLTLMPWFFLLVVALVAAYKRHDARAKFYVSWLLAVLVPYSVISSKLDVYMMALIPPVALLIARLLDVPEHVNDRFWTWGRRANVVMIAVFALIGVAGLFVQPHHIKGPDGALAAMPVVKGLFVTMLLAAIVALVVTLRARLTASTIALGFIPVASFVYAALILMPLANEQASDRPLVRAILQQQVPAGEVACHVCPHLWTRGMPRELEAVLLVDAEELRGVSPRVIVTRRRDTEAIAPSLAGYRKVDEFRMIGKWFDVYRK
jgi:4-amino-4-deoxy-L-arabinose transferase-like glycosyltransferase